MVLSLSYRRPAHVSRDSINTEKSGGAESQSSGSSCPYGIPDALSFDRIINGGTCPPVTTREFMDFLIYIEHDAENLQFYLWYRDYVKRWSELPEREQGLAPIWTPEQAQQARNEALTEKSKKVNNADAAQAFRGTDFDSKPKRNQDTPNPFSTPPRTPSNEVGRDSMATAPSTVGWSDDGSTLGSSVAHHQKTSANAFVEVGAHQPFTIQPYREEISRIISIYFAEGSVRYLNLSGKERTALLKALSITTHPSAFKDVVATIEYTLRHQLHPNFIRWTICNGNAPRQTFARGLGIGGIVAGLVYGIIITLSDAGRGWRALAFLAFFIGISTLFAAWKGMCVVLHGMHHRHLRPWELFGSDDTSSSGYDLKKDSFDTLGSANSFEDEPWVAKYDKRNVIRKIFDREVWIQEPALRSIQDTIFIQALITAFVIGGVLTAIFLAVPAGNKF
ncbi:hypothetical protein PMZ80_007016 [Knufia obscura]|uniref:RGS domain-containing protein n=2 Tax=Knufia TaxID=430999 RepID=A0AAN8ES65_9EURO|nr:hypothetical protein PMZ80_007016 [Knufia obscura]KAK5957552.1 hypothetical protein OHC33_001928 [Knufia fluminis]